VIAWREKTRAFAIHFLVTLTLTASALTIGVGTAAATQNALRAEGALWSS